MKGPWFVRQPALFGREVAELARDYGEMKRNEAAFASGHLLFEGPIVVALGAQNVPIHLTLVYPDGFPYLAPMVVPMGDPEGAQQKRRPRFFSARHQMANGSICLFERDPNDDPRAYVSGIVALRRARTWLPHALRGSLPPELDSLEAELESHYERFGDVLLGPMMFENLGDGGELILDFLRSGGRNESYPLHMVSHLETNGKWTNDEQVLRRVGADRTPEFWAASPPSATGLPRVRWYALSQEPSPFRSLSELARVLYPKESAPLSRLKRDVTADRVSRNAIDIPLRFPGRRPGAFEWLFLRAKIRKSSLPTVKVGSHSAQVLDLSGADDFADAPLGVLRTHDLRKASLTVRNSTRVPADAGTLSFGLAGAGALGSACADLLGKAGVGAMQIVDPALLNAHNAVRHLGSVSSAGIPKAAVVAATVNAHNPHCDISFEGQGVLDLADDHAFWKATAVLSTIADDAIELALNRVAVEAKVTVYYLRALRSGSAGRLIRVRPGVDACLECVGHYHAAGDERAVAIPAHPDEIITRECGQPVLAASAADLAIVAGLGVRTLLADAVSPSDLSQWAWTSEGIPEHRQLQEPFSAASAKLAPHKSCGICGIAVPRKALMAPGVREAMVTLARKSAPNETGGILIGRRVGDAIEVIAASDAGPNAVSEPARFERDGAHCQAFLKRVVEELGGGVDFVGEWHSHPASSPMPSGRDTASFAEIAEDPNYLTTTPLLIIVAPASTGEAVDWSSTVFPLGGRSRSVTLEDVAASSAAGQTASIAAAAAAPSDSTT